MRPLRVCVRVTVVEIDSESRPAEAVLGELEEHLARTSSDLVVLPELPFSPWFMERPNVDGATWARSIDDHRAGLDRLRRLGVPAVVLSVPRTANGRRHHDAVLLEAAGDRRLHTKAYLPNEPGAFEAAWYEADGATFDVHPAAGTAIGVLMCSELWYPEHARALGRAGAVILAAPRATHRATLDRWMAVLRVDAIVSGAYVVSSNRVGRQGDVEFGGAGAVVDPGGRVLATTSPDCPFVTLEIDLDATARARAAYPCTIVEPAPA
jgi:N-carbamoylputrescine amidase